jgi:hypothetical protein
VQFCKLIAKRFSFHAFAPLTEDNTSKEQEEEYLAQAMQQKLQKQQTKVDRTPEARGNNNTLKTKHKGSTAPHRSTVVSSRTTTATTTTTSTAPTTTSIPPSSPLHSPMHAPMHHARPRASSPPIDQKDRRWDPRRHDERKNTDQQTEEENVLEMLWAAYV